MTRRPPGRRGAAGLGNDAAGVGHVVEHEHQQGGVQLAVGDRQLLERALPQLDVRGMLEPRAGGVEHLR